MSQLLPDGKDWDELQALNVKDLHLRDDAWILYRKQQLESCLKHISELMDITPRWKRQDYARMKTAFRTHSRKLAILNGELRNRCVTVALPINQM